MTEKDIRWEQRFSNFLKAFDKLNEAVSKISIDEEGNIDNDNFLDDIIKEGLIQRFEYTHELAWNVMKDFLANVGDVKIYGSKDATREAFKAELIQNGDVWMDMISSRNITSHTYNEETADEIFMKVVNDYYDAFSSFKKKMEKLRSK